MKLFRTDNTEDYNQAECDALNQEWEELAHSMNLGENTEEYEIQAKAFCDEVSRR